MKKIARVLFTWFGMVLAMNAVAGNVLDIYTGLSIDSARSSLHDSSAGLTAILSSRYTDKNYGYEVQGGYFGKSGTFTANIKADLCAIGLLPLGSGGLNLYGKFGAAEVLSTMNVHNLSPTYGAGVEYQRKGMAFRLGIQHFSVGNSSLSSSLSTNLIGVTLLVK